MIRLEMLWNTIANYFDQFRFIWPLEKGFALAEPFLVIPMNDYLNT